MFGERIEVVWGDSSKTIPQYTATHALACDVLVVDGAHLYAGVYEDLKNLLPCVKAKARVFCDDAIYKTKADAKKLSSKSKRQHKK